MKQKVRFLSIEEDRVGQRLDNFLIGQLKGVPRSLVYRIVRKGEVRVNKGRCKPDYKLKYGDMVRIPPVRVPTVQEIHSVGDGLANLLKGAVLYESSGLIIINKPTGLAVHGGSGVNIGLIEGMQQVFPEYRFLELVHRLDRDTSGCVMVAKKRSTLRTLHDQLRQRGKISKRYHALVVGGWPKECQQVDKPLLRYLLPSGERMVKVNSEGKSSLTRVRILRELDAYTLIEAQPITGRTHQIRVHCQCLGHPIIGDAKYGNLEINDRHRKNGFKRMFLHAAQLGLVDPSTNVTINVQAPYDKALTKQLEWLKIKGY